MRIKGPPNPVVADPHGHDYRKVPARQWAAGANLDPDVSAVAWALASESPDIERYPQYSRAIGHAILNAAADARISPHARVTMEGVKLMGGRLAPHAGHYARQRGRWCASLQWPHHGHLDQARAVCARAAPGHEARLWADLRLMDRGWQAGRRLVYDAIGIVRRRWIGRWAWVGPLDDIDPFVLCLFRPRRPGDDLEAALAMVADGRRRWLAERV